MPLPGKEVLTLPTLAEEQPGPILSAKTPWKVHCHGDILGCLGQSTISNRAIVKGVKYLYVITKALELSQIPRINFLISE